MQETIKKTVVLEAYVQTSYDTYSHIFRTVEIEIPDDRWFRGEWQFKPQDKQLCIIIPKEYITEIGMYDERHNRFLRVNTTATVRELFGNTKYYSAWVHITDVDRWKPLGLPEDVNDRILAEIEKFGL